MPYATLLSTAGGYFLQADSDGGVLAVEEKGSVRRSVEDAYDERHQRGYQWSMSSCMHYIEFNPVEVEIPSDVAKVQAMLDGGVEGAGAFVRISAVSGFYYGWKITKEAADELLKTANQPALISEETFKKTFR